MLSALETRQAARRQDHLDQPAARGRAWSTSATRRSPAASSASGTDLSDLHLPIKINGDLALFQAIGSLLVEWDALDHDFIDRYTTGSRRGATTSAPSTGTRSTAATGLTREQITDAAPSCSRDSDGDRLLLGDGPDPAPQRGGHHQGDRQPRLRPGQHRQARRRAAARCAATPTCRATGRWGSGSGRRRTSWTRCRPSSASTRRASTATTPSTRSARCATARRTSSSGSAATSSRPPRTPR